MIATRRRGRKGYIELPKFGRWIMDNGAFGDWKHGSEFDDEEYQLSLDRVLALQP